MSDWANLLLAGFLLPIVGGVLGSWLWNKYDATDFAARRSIASTQKRIEKLEHKLRIFDYILKDTARYLAKIILDGVMVIALFLRYIVNCGSFSVIAMYLYLHPVNNVVEQYIFIYIWIINTIGMLVFAFFGTRQFMILLTECMLPERYKSELSERIARLRNRALR